MDDYSVKSPIPEVGIPQEKFTGDILKGRGPRRGNLERLLRYWRPIMRKEGGFRRCRVILADHPELYPLANICAWLHHETTGLWPNEGCHHPGMKNCRRKMKNVLNGSIWSDSKFSQRLEGMASAGKKGLNISIQNDVFFSPDWYNGKSLIFDGMESHVVTESDLAHAISVLNDFLEMEPSFVQFLIHEDNWEFVGEGENGGLMSAPSLPSDDCGCG
jgi:hypothetical protein